MTRLLAERRKRPDYTPEKLAAIEQEIANIMNAIKAGILTPTTKHALAQAEAERARLLQEQQTHNRSQSKAATVLPDLAAEFKGLVEGLSVTQHQVDKARGQIKQLVGAVTLHPRKEGGDRYLTAELTGDYEGLLRLVVPKINVVAVTRIERVTRGL